MGIQSKSYLVLTDESGERNSWSISFSKEGNKMSIGLHWNDKPQPTHTFEADFKDFLHEIEKLK